MQWLRNGATRRVLLIGRWALKFPNPTSSRSFANGMVSNLQEQEWTTMGSSYTCPVLWSLPLGLLNVMPRCRALSDAEWATLDTRAFLEECARECGAAPVVEEKQCSFGVLENRIVVVDYG